MPGQVRFTTKGYIRVRTDRVTSVVILSKRSFMYALERYGFYRKRLINKVKVRLG